MIWIDAGRLGSTGVRLGFDRERCRNETPGAGLAGRENELESVEFLLDAEENNDAVEAEEIDDRENRLEGGRKDEEPTARVEPWEGAEVWRSESKKNDLEPGDDENGSNGSKAWIRSGSAR